MKRGLSVALVLCGFLAGSLAAAPRLYAQSPAGGGAPQPAPSKPAAEGQKPVTPPAQSGNPFPEDTTSVPVIPATSTPAEAAADRRFSESGGGSDSGLFPFPAEDADPVRSPDDSSASGSGEENEEFSSSLKGIDNLLPGPEGDVKGKPKEPEHRETAATDIDVGKYYLDKKNWKAALSRFQSAMVLDPENPEVYWGLAEAEHRLGDLANARAHYRQLLDYDPDGPHGKQARKALQDPAIANARKATDNQPPAAAQK